MSESCPSCGRDQPIDPTRVEAPDTCAFCDTRLSGDEDHSTPALHTEGRRVKEGRGFQVEGYEIRGELGRGGMGVVYLARQVSLGRDVAIKVLSPVLTHRKEFVRRFEREARLMSALRHPGIVAVHDKGIVGDRYYLVMDYVAGSSMREEMDDGKLGAVRALGIGMMVLRALDHAHRQGIIHRDVKPDNVLLDSNGDAHLSDFGIAGMENWDDEPHTRLTRTGAAMGTRGYMAPEQSVDSKRVDHRADLFATGAMIFEALTGDLPVGTVKFPSERGVAVDARVDEVLRKLLAPDPGERYASAALALKDLEELASTGFQPRGARSAGPRPVTTVITPGPGSAASAAPSALGRVLKGAAVLGFGGIALVAGYLVVDRRMNPQATTSPVVRLRRLLSGAGLAEAPAAAAPLRSVLKSLAIERPRALAATERRVVVVSDGSRAGDGLLLAMDPASLDQATAPLDGTPGGICRARGGEELLVGLKEERTLLHVDVEKFKVLARLKLPLEPTGVGVLADGSVIVTGRGGPVALLSPDLRRMRRLDREATTVAVSTSRETAVLASATQLMVLRLVELHDAAADATVVPGVALDLRGVEGLCCDPSGHRVVATIPAAGVVASLALPKLTGRQDRRIDRLAAGCPAFAGAELCLPTEDGVVWALPAGELEPVALGPGPKDLLLAARRLFVSRHAGGAVDVLE